jgi:hypothetical protein
MADMDKKIVLISSELMGNGDPNGDPKCDFSTLTSLKSISHNRRISAPSVEKSMSNSIKELSHDEWKVLKEAIIDDNVNALRDFITSHPHAVPPPSQLFALLCEGVRRHSRRIVRAMFDLKNLLSNSGSIESGILSDCEQWKIPFSTSDFDPRCPVFGDSRQLASLDPHQDGSEMFQLLIECGGREYVNDIVSAPADVAVGGGSVNLRVIHLLSRDNHPTLLPLLYRLGVDLNARIQQPYRRMPTLQPYIRRKAADGDHLINPERRHPAGSTVLHMVSSSITSNCVSSRY